MNKLTTDEILTKDAHLIQSFANLNALKQDQARTAIVSAKGAHVTDSEGNQLIDGIGGLWCVNVGHGRPEIIDAIANQLKTLDYYSTFYNFTHPSAAALAEKIAQLAPDTLNHVYFGNSGSVANRQTEETDHAVAHRRLSRLYAHGDGPDNTGLLGRMDGFGRLSAPPTVPEPISRSARLNRG